MATLPKAKWCRRQTDASFISRASSGELVFAHNASRYQSDDARCAGVLQSAKRCLPTREFQERPLAPCLLCCLKILQTGDRLIVWKLDRLGRSLHDLITMLDDLRQRGVKFRS